MIQTYIRYYYAGAFCSDMFDQKVENREMPKTLPKRAYAFLFYDQEEVTINDEILKGNPKNFSPTYYPGGIIMDIDQVRKSVPNSKILVDNMEGNNIDEVVKTRVGNFQYFEDAEIIPDILS